MSAYWSEVADLARQVASAGKCLEDFLQRVPDPWKAADKEAFAALHADLLQAQDAYSSFEHSRLEV
ncbi:hypothetical protein HX819_01125 [Pseudomonas sp. D6002]|uniref:hypothetical protein n=1 Tax=unclassified Pseudomonas TaxID=196821 RepID=UPI0015A3AEEE|nr:MULTISPECIES: hypothetical protein [unclassified Pseudomonas]NVZ94162.1 hypothetical protein [Pseudomonas sp. B6001]NWB12991.1 hypothetical protein [Pseudomonas sp. D6002]